LMETAERRVGRIQSRGCESADRIE